MAQTPSEITVPVCEAAAEALDRPATDLPPLADVIDPTGLDALVSADPPADVTVSFPYAGLRVVVRSDASSGASVSVFPLREAQSDSRVTSSESAADADSVLD